MGGGRAAVGLAASAVGLAASPPARRAILRALPSSAAERDRHPVPAPGGTPRARVLVLTGSIGEGHNALASACAAALREDGFQADQVDVMKSLGHRPGQAAERVFRDLLNLTPVYDAFHFSQLRDGGPLAQLAERLAVERATPVVAGRVGPRPVDLMLSVFATGAGVASRLKAQGACSRSVVFIPDSSAHRMWVHAETDLFLVSSRLGAATVRRYRPDAAVSVVAPPLREEFLRPLGRAEARLSLGLPSEATCVLLMGGGWGLGPVLGMSEALTAAGHHVIAVAGHNEDLLARLRHLAERQPRLRPVGFTDRVSTLMAACDLVVTTAGMTCQEARAVGRGLILLDVVPGHGRENLSHQLELGSAAVSQVDPGQLTATVAACLDDEEFRRPPPRLRTGPGRSSFLRALYDHELLPIAPRGAEALGDAPAR